MTRRTERLLAWTIAIVFSAAAWWALLSIAWRVLKGGVS
jgi:hypothetical protein